MRLIDADKIGLTDFEIVMCNGDYKKALTMLLDKISNQPTAYDTDKVVEELEKQRDIIFQNTDSEIRTVRANAWDKIDILNKAIEIVKQSSVSDNVCEWKIDGDMAINPHNLSRYKIKQYDGLYMLDTCHHCRKKIKVVE